MSVDASGPTTKPKGAKGKLPGLSPEGAPGKAAYLLAWLTARGWSRVWFRLSIDGLHNVPESGAYVVAPVHRSNLDTVLVGCSVSTRRLRFLAKASLWDVKGLDWVVGTLGGVPVKRGTADKEALRRIVSIARAGEPVVLFAEGTRQSGPVVEPIFDGPAYVASRAGVPIVPVGIGGSEEAMPKGAKFVRPHRICIVIGEPIAPLPLQDNGTVSRVALRETTERLHGAMQAVFDEARIRAGAI